MADNLLYFGQSRTIEWGTLTEEEKERFTQLFCENNISFYQARDADGTPIYATNIKLYDPELFDDDGQSVDENTKDKRKESKRTESKQSVAEKVMDIRPYSRISNLVKGADTVVPKERALPWVMRLVEELYDLRYSRDIAELKEEANDDNVVGLSSQPFPEFVYDFFKKRYGLQSIVQSTLWDLIYSVDKLRDEKLEVGIFARFLDKTYDVDDLLFFLYVRSVIQKELNVNFRGLWSEGRTGVSGTSSDAIYLSARDCAFVARIVFGSELDPLYRTFMRMIESALNSSASSSGSGNRREDTRRIELATFLHLALIEYHETRPVDSDEEDGDDQQASGHTTAPGTTATYTKHADSDISDTAPPRHSTAPGAANASMGSSPGHSASHSSTAPDTASIEASREVLEALGAALGVAQELLLDSLMAPCASFPPAVAAQIRTEASSTLEKKVYSLLGEVVAAHQKIVNGSGEPVYKNAETKILTSQYQTLVHSATVQGHSVEQLSGALAILAEGVVNASVVKDSVIALTNKLVDFSRQKLHEVHGMRQ